MKRYAFVGASGRALSMYLKPMIREYTDVCTVVGAYDINPGRTRQMLIEANTDFPVFYDFDEMINKAKPDVVIVTTTDVYHSDYIIRSLELGCDVITEKPMTTTDDRVRKILETEKRTGKKVTVTFNYRYMPIVTKMKEIMMSNAIGKVYGIHFEWMLAQNMIQDAHGTSYFRRWNSRMALSSGLLVHKGTHHFDMINWWLNDHPKIVSGFGKLNMYGAVNSPWKDVPSDGLTCRNCQHSSECQFYRPLNDFEKRYYADQEKFDTNTPHPAISLKDNCIYAKDIDIYDTMALNIEYQKGTLLSYSLNATTSYEGWRAVFNGEKGRIELGEHDTGLDSHLPYNVISVFDTHDNCMDYRISKMVGEHGGGDVRLRNQLFRGVCSDPLGYCAGSIDGAYSVLCGIAGNIAIKEHRYVSIEDLLRD